MYKTHRMNRRWLAALILIPLMAACGGSDDADEPIPTLAELGGGEATEAVLAEDATESATAPDDNATPDAPTETSVEATPELSAAAQTPEATPGPLDLAGPTLQSDAGSEMLPPISAIEDFGALEVGDSGVFVGLLSIEDDGTILVTDDAGVSIEMALDAPVLVTDFDGVEIQATGVIDEPREGSDRLRLLPSTFGAAVTAEMTPMAGMPDFLAEVTPTVPDFLLSGPSPQMEVLDFQLEEDLTALEAYDALIEEIGEDVAGLTWFEISGSAGTAWVVRFYDEENATTNDYRVERDGSVGTQTTQVPLLGNLPIFPIERERVVVDSDDLVPDAEATPEPGGPPVGLPPVDSLLTLRAPDEERIEWVIQDVEIRTVDATTPIEE